MAQALADDLDQAAGPPAFVAIPTDGLGRLSVCQAAAAGRCRPRIVYNSRARVVHPINVLLRPRGWYLRAVDEEDDIVKQFATDRIHGLVMDAPGTARRPPVDPPEPIWDFMRRRGHAPVTVSVTVMTTQEHLPEVLSALEGNGHEVVQSEDPDDVHVEVVATNTDALTHRVLEQGTRVRREGPESVREILRERLMAAAGAR